MADEEVGEEQVEEQPAETDAAVETEVADEPAGDEASAASEAEAGDESAEAEEDGDADDAGQEAIDAVENLESQLGEVLSSLDGLASGGQAMADFSGAAGRGTGTAASIDLLRDVQLKVKIELGRSRMYIEDILRLGEGSIVELDKLAGDPVDVFVNDRLVARGEVLVLNDNFCVRIGEIIAQD